MGGKDDTFSSTDIPTWLKSMPVAPEYRPTLAEFRDPIAYILKIESEASKYGICKIIPPVPAPSRKSAVSNLSRSFAARHPRGAPAFTTRQQQVGFCPRRPRPVRRPVWQSGEWYTLTQFEARAKQFEKTRLKRKSKQLGTLETEAMFWDACAGRPFTVEYANDMPGSGFHPPPVNGGGSNLGETAWNMRGVSRANGSLLQFMKEEIPGVTSPMVYVAMMFSWFAWHVEDHELHSLNYLHMGAGKTWYGVPRDAAFAFEDVIRMQGYGGEVNPLVTFADLGEKTTVMTPEVLIEAGIPCCRLVQNPGEFVVTFPGSYHSGFSHGFNCGEAANIATPGWLKVAKEAAIRRASTNHPPMVSHLQLLYALALSLGSRLPAISSEPRSSRLKDKMRGEGEGMVKEIFVQNMAENNHLLSILLDEGFSCIALPEKTADCPLYCGSLVRSQAKLKPRFSLGASGISPSYDLKMDRNEAFEHLDNVSVLKSSNDFYERKNLVVAKNGRFGGLYEKENSKDADEQLDQGMLSCVTCGILSYACVAVIQPREATVRYLMYADCSSFTEHIPFPGEASDASEADHDSRQCQVDDESADDYADRSARTVVISEDKVKIAPESQASKMISGLDILASLYGDTSDSDEEPPNEVQTDELGLNEAVDAEATTLNNSSDNFGQMEDPCSPCPKQVEPVGCNGHAKASNGDLVEMSPTLDVIANENATASETRKNCDSSVKSSNLSAMRIYNNDSCKMHIFCLEHAVEVENQLRIRGGVDIMLLCHPDYRKLENEAKLFAEELEMDHNWEEIPFREATKEDQDRIQMALEDEEAIPTSGDWTVKMGINLYYSANLSKAPLYCKQMPYNAIIYKAFPCNVQGISSGKTSILRKKPRRQKKIIVAGKWCGKVWMSNQVHPFLAQKAAIEEEQEDLDDEPHGRFSTVENPKVADTVNSTSLRRSESKRKLASSRKVSAKRIRCSRKEESYIKKDVAEESVEHSGRILRSTRSNRKKRNWEDEEDGGPSTRLRVRQQPKSKQVNLKKATQKQNINRKAKKSQSANFDSEEELIDHSYNNNRIGNKKGKKSRTAKIVSEEDLIEQSCDNKQIRNKKGKKSQAAKLDSDEEANVEFACDIEGCEMTLKTKHELMLHKKNICPVEGCKKKLFSHKYMLQHQKVHMDDRPLKCPWKGCKMSFKWAWARTEHIRVHTGVRPYVCKECGQTFRFVSDFSRHKRKTGHVSAKKKRGA